MRCVTSKQLRISLSHRLTGQMCFSFFSVSSVTPWGISNGGDRDVAHPAGLLIGWPRPAYPRGSAMAIRTIGIILEGYAMGRSPEALCAEMLRVLGEQATTQVTNADRLRLVGMPATTSDRDDRS